MMNRQKAAQYFIVAWIKDWRLSAYLDVLADGGPAIRYDQAHHFYRWLPDTEPFERHFTVRAYLGECNRPLSDALLDARDDLARLALATRVEAFVFTERFRYSDNLGRTIARDEQRRLHRNGLLIQEHREARQRRRGTHWQVCK
jgi:hypothetical protein